MSFKEILNKLSNDPDLRAMTELEKEELKKILLKNYLYIQSFCENHGLTVMLVGGSALGAVRHKGFIPWDDDLDMAMPREDFEIFKSLFDRELSDRYTLDAPNYSVKATNRFPKILIKGTKLVELGMENDESACIKLDLFIIENIPQNPLIYYLHGLICTAAMFIAGNVDSFENQNDRFRKFMYKTKEGARVFNRRIRIGKCFSFWSAYKWFNIVDNICNYNHKTKFLGIPTGRRHYFGETLPCNAFLPVSKGLFENCSINLPGDPDKYLTNLYGEYMTIPKEVDREKHFIYDIKFY